MAQGVFDFQYEVENKSGGMTGLAGDDDFCRILKGIERDLLTSSVESLSGVYANRERALFLQRLVFFGI
jgi:hypothetical protein